MPLEQRSERGSHIEATWSATAGPAVGHLVLSLIGVKLTVIFRSYRDRKDRYTKALEKELAQSRSNEARLMQESEQLRVTVQNIAKLLSQHGILVPPEVDAAVLSTSNVETPGISSVESVETLPSPQLFSPESFGDYYLCSDKEVSSPSNTTRHMSSAVYHSGRSVRVCELDQAVVAMEFVLK